jgi:hypothetical protein
MIHSTPVCCLKIVTGNSLDKKLEMYLFFCFASQKNKFMEKHKKTC